MVLHRSVVRSGAIVAANSVVLNDVDVPSGALAAGSPAVIKPGRADIDLIRNSAAAYVDRIVAYRTDLRRLD
jgi:acetyltransferase-like isoleucine patch superfamily enzyme